MPSLTDDIGEVDMVGEERGCDNLSPVVNSVWK
jgi:hypothetical protein